MVDYNKLNGGLTLVVNLVWSPTCLPVVNRSVLLTTFCKQTVMRC